MTDHVATAALRAVGADRDIGRLARGMSSSAWIGSDGDRRFVVRVPNADGARPRPDYRREIELLHHLDRRGVPVAVASLLDVGGVECSLAPELVGRPARPADWDEHFAAQFARALSVLHQTDSSHAIEADPITRFHLGTIWPLDGTECAEHPAATRWPDLVAGVGAHRDDILEAAARRPTVVHTDLHPDHVIVEDLPSGPSLVGILDFGDAFAGPAAWDHACVRYYHGDRAADLVLDETPAPPVDVERLRRDEVLLGAAFALYKLSKTPERDDVADRVGRMLRRLVA